MKNDAKAMLDPLTGLRYRGCDVCRHFDPTGLPRCAAYPDGIPLPILGGDIAHDRPLPGDHGIQFEPLSAAELRAREEQRPLGIAERKTMLSRLPRG